MLKTRNFSQRTLKLAFGAGAVLVFLAVVGVVDFIKGYVHVPAQANMALALGYPVAAFALYKWLFRWSGRDPVELLRLEKGPRPGSLTCQTCGCKSYPKQALEIEFRPLPTGLLPDDWCKEWKSLRDPSLPAPPPPPPPPPDPWTGSLILYPRSRPSEDSEAGHAQRRAVEDLLSQLRPVKRARARRCRRCGDPDPLRLV